MITIDGCNPSNRGSPDVVDIGVPAPNPAIAGLEGSVDVPNVAEGLRARGYRDDEVAKVMGENWLRLYRAVWEG